MRTYLNRLWLDQRGAMLSLELVLVGTLVIIGMIVGLATYRDAVVQELGDASAAIASLSQGYSFTAIAASGNFGLLSVDFDIAGATYVDELDLGQAADPDIAGAAPMCITITQNAVDEGDVISTGGGGP